MATTEHRKDFQVEGLVKLEDLGHGAISLNTRTQVKAFTLTTFRILCCTSIKLEKVLLIFVVLVEGSLESLVLNIKTKSITRGTNFNMHSKRLVP